MNIIMTRKRNLDFSKYEHITKLQDCLRESSMDKQETQNPIKTKPKKITTYDQQIEQFYQLALDKFKKGDYRKSRELCLETLVIMESHNIT